MIVNTKMRKQLPFYKGELPLRAMPIEKTKVEMFGHFGTLRKLWSMLYYRRIYLDKGVCCMLGVVLN
jgi:hypothetical protein